MVIFKLFMDIVKIGWVRVIYDGSGNFQVLSGFLWPELSVPQCMLKGTCKPRWVVFIENYSVIQAKI